MRLGTQEGRPTHAQHETATIWECWLELVHACTDLNQIAVQLAIIERSQVHPHDVCFSHHPSGQAKEREQPLPRRMSIRGGEVVITDPCKFQRKREREMSLNRQDQVVLSAKYFNVSAKKAHIFSVNAKKVH